MQPLVRRCQLIVLAAVVACTGVRAAAAEDPLEINVVLPLTGAVAFLGKSSVSTFDAVEKLTNAHGGVNGRPIKFVYADEASNPQVAVQLVNGIIAKKVPIFLGSVLAASCSAYAPLLANGGPVDYCLAPVVHAPAGGYVFVCGASSVDNALVMARYFRERGLTRLAIITGTDATGQDMDAAFNTAFALPANRGLTIVDHEHFSPTDISVAAQIARIKAANPQALISWTIGTSTGTVFRGIRDGGLDIPVATSNGNMLYEALAQFSGILPKELLFSGYRAMTEGDVAAGPIRDMQNAYFTSFRDAGVRPGIAQVTSWDAIMIAIDALRHVGPRGTAEQVRQYIAGLHGWAGVNSIYDFRDGSQRGVGVNALVMDRWDPAKNTWVAISKPGGALR